MNKSLLDTDIFSEVLKGIDQTVVTKAVAYRSTWGRYTISTITVLEIIKGLHKVKREARIQQFLAGRIYADLERIGQPIGRADPMIAAIALHQDLTLITSNMSHYRRIETIGYPIKLENWRE